MNIPRRLRLFKKKLYVMTLLFFFEGEVTLTKLLFNLWFFHGSGRAQGRKERAKRNLALNATKAAHPAAALSP